MVEFERDPSSDNDQDLGVYRLWTEEDSELIGQYYHEGPLAVPREGETLRLLYSKGQSIDDFEEEFNAKYRISNIEYGHILHEWEDDDGNLKDVMYGLVDLTCEGPLEEE